METKPVPTLAQPAEEITQRALWSWPLALVAGVLYALASLHYTAYDRINVLVVWLLWAGVPLIGALLSIWAFRQSRHRPWLFRIFQQRADITTPESFRRVQMLLVLQVLWLLFGLGLLLGFAVQLLITDLAFGWRSTIALDESVLARLLQWLAWPWHAWWPAALPDSALLAETRFQRIDPESAPTDRAGDWWPFLMASLLFYHLLPRVLLTCWCFWRWRRLRPARLEVTAPPVSPVQPSEAAPLQYGRLSEWRDACRLAWEWNDPLARYCLGQDDWQREEQTMDQVLNGHPGRLYWSVPGHRSPVAELADRIQQAREAGITGQGILVRSTGSEELSERHVASWQAFARQQGLSWLQHE